MRSEEENNDDEMYGRNPRRRDMRRRRRLVQWPKRREAVAGSWRGLAKKMRGRVLREKFEIVKKKSSTEWVGYEEFSFFCIFFFNFILMVRGLNSKRP